MSKRYRAKTKDGYRSQFEHDVSKKLKAILSPIKAKAYYEAEALEYSIVKKYIPDFVIELRDGRKIYVEAKGYFPYEDRVKMEAVKKLHPDLDIRILFSRDGKLSRTSKARYSDWANKNGYPFAIGEVPKEWFE